MRRFHAASRTTVQSCGRAARRSGS